MLRLDRLSAFRVFAELGSFTRAAEVLHISQPALHVQIKQLGEEVGAPLYRREGRGVRLTREGRELAAFAREIEDRTDRFLDELHGRTPDRPVVLCAGEASTRYLLAPALSRFVASGGRLRLRVANAEMAVQRVASGEAHLAFTVPGALPEGLFSEKVGRVGTVALVPAHDELATRRAVLVSDLAGRALIVPPPERPHRQRIDQALQGISWTASTEVQGWELMAQLVSVGLGVALVNDFVPAPEGSCAIPFLGLPDVDYHLVRRRDAPSFEALDDLSRAIREAVWSD